jgi:hypothetical protein
VTRRAGREGTLGLAVAGMCALLGAPLGLVWTALAPHLAYVTILGDGFFTGFQPVVGGDLVYGAVTAVAGLALGAAVRLLTGRLPTGRGRSDGAVLAGLVVGAAAAALVASRIGPLVRARGIAAFVRTEVAAGYSRTSIEHYFVPVVDLAVHARLLLGVLPALALLAYLATDALLTDRGTPPRVGNGRVLSGADAGSR